MNIQKLENTFTGKGEVKDFNFVQLDFLKDIYIYKVGNHFEVFKAKIVPICIDFENRIYSETDFKHVYPKSKDFGVTAWTYKELKSAKKMFNYLKKTSNEHTTSKI